MREEAYLAIAKSIQNLAEALIYHANVLDAQQAHTHAPQCDTPPPNGAHPTTPVTVGGSWTAPPTPAPLEPEPPAPPDAPPVEEPEEEEDDEEKEPETVGGFPE